MSNLRRLGKEYEQMAAGYLVGKGCRILERNFYTKFGELDLIVRSPEGTIVAVEVKYRQSNAFGDPAEAVDPRKMHRMGKAFSYYLLKHPARADLRFDIIAISGPGRIRHIPDAFGFQG